METNTQLLKCDGGLTAVFTYRTQPNTPAGTVWRLILDGQTLVVVPYQTPHAPAPAAHCVPERIESVLSELDLVVRCVSQAGTSLNSDTCRAIDEATEKELAKCKGKRPWRALEQWDRDCLAAHQERERRWKEAGLTGDDTPPAEKLAEWQAAGKDVAQKTEAWRMARCEKRRKIGVEVLAYVNDPHRMEAVKTARAEVDKKRREIEARVREPFEAQAAQAAARERAEVFLRLNELIGDHGGKPPVQLPPLPAGAKRYGPAATQKIVKALTNTKTKGGQTLKALFDFIRDDVCEGNARGRIIRDEDLRRVLVKVKELTGADLTESLTLKSAPDMPALVAGLARLTAEAEKITEDQARRQVLERVRFVAGFSDGKRTLIESLVRDVQEAKDSKVFQRVDPGAAIRKEIEARLKAIEQEGKARREQNVMMHQFREKNPTVPLFEPSGVGCVADKQVRRAYIKETYNLSDQQISKQVDYGTLKANKREGKDGKPEGRAFFYKSQVDQVLGRRIK